VRVHAEISASNTRVDGDISSTMRVTERHSEIPRTRSAFPTRSSGPVPTGCAAACASEKNGLRQICIGWTREGSAENARITASVPSSNSEYPWHVIGVVTCLRITLYGSSSDRPSSREWNT
jgi:hypothetical protein